MKKRLALLAVLFSTPASAQSYGPPAEPEFRVEETGQIFFTLQEAVRAIGDGRGTIRIGAGTYQECITQDGGDIAYVAERPGQVIFDTVTCEGKAAFVLRGNNATVEGIVFQNMQVPDQNGAGIRLEHGNLTVRETLFRNSESGILSSADAGGAVRIERSTFSGLGICPEGGSCAHSIYINGSGPVSIVSSRFERGTGGHYVKSRSPRIEILDSSFDDSAGHATNYMIDLPAGASGVIARNELVQGRDKENYSAFIAVAGEGEENGPSQLLVAGNNASLVPGLSRPTVFVADWSASPVRIEGNNLDSQLSRYERRRR